MQQEETELNYPQENTPNKHIDSQHKKLEEEITKSAYEEIIFYEKEPQQSKLKNYFNYFKFEGKTKSSSNNNGPKLYKMRWIILLIFTLAKFCTMWAMTTFSSASTIVMQYYNIEQENWKVNMLTMIFIIVNIPSSLGVSFVMKRYGIRWCMIIFGVLTCCGSWIRCLGYQGGDEMYLWVVFCGQTFIALGQPFAASIAGLLGMNWFGDKERTLVQVVTLLTTVLGGGVSYAIGPTLLTMNKTEMSGSETGMLIYLLVQAVMTSLCLVLIFVYMKDKPPTPPVNIKENQTLEEKTPKLEEQGKNMDKTPIEEMELTESRREEVEQSEINMEEQLTNEIKTDDSKDVYPEQTFIQGFKKLLTSPHFIMLLISWSCMISVFQSTTLLDQIITPKGYTAFDGAWFNIVSLTFTVVGCFGLSILFDKTKKFKLIVAISTFMTCIGFGCFSIILLWERTDFLMVMACLSFVVIGCFTVPSLPLLSQMLVYSTYPVHPATGLVISSIFSTVWSIIYMAIINIIQSQVSDSSTIIIWMDFALLCVSFLMIALFRGTFSKVLSEPK